MTSAPNPEQLAKLGLQPEQITTVETLRAAGNEGVAEGAVGSALTWASLLAFLQLQPTPHDPEFLARSAPAAEQAGFTSQVEATNSRILQVTGLGAVQVVGEVNWRPDPDDESTVFLELASEPALVRDSTGSQLVVFHHDGDAQVAAVAAEPVPVQPLAKLTSPVQSWLEGELHDQALVTLLQHRAQTPQAWSQAVAVGAYGRLRELSPDERQEAMQLLLQGKPHPAAVRHLEWVRALSQPELETLEDLSQASVDLLHQSLDELQEAPRPDDDGWRAGLVALCHQRDDLEGVLALLRAVGRAEVIQDAAGGFDERARTFLLTVPDLAPVEDERLRRVLERQPEVWWANLGPHGDVSVLA